MSCLLESSALMGAILDDARVGLWCIETDADGSSARLYADAVFLDMMGMDAGLSPEDAFRFWQGRVCEEDRTRVKVLVDEMSGGRHCEAEYAWRHPVLGTIRIRCGGRRDPGYAAGVRLHGSHQVVTDIARVRRSLEGRLRSDLLEGSVPDDLEGRFDAMLRALAGDYIALYHYDRAKRSFTAYLLDDWARATWQIVEGQWYPYHVMSLFIETFVDERDKDGMRPFADADYVMERLEKSPAHTVVTRFTCLYDGERRAMYWKIGAVYTRGSLEGFAVAFALDEGIPPKGDTDDHPRVL